MTLLLVSDRSKEVIRHISETMSETYGLTYENFALFFSLIGLFFFFHKYIRRETKRVIRR